MTSNSRSREFVRPSSFVLMMLAAGSGCHGSTPCAAGGRKPAPNVHAAAKPSTTVAPPNKVSVSPKFVGLAGSCAWRDDGSLWCWGGADALPPSDRVDKFCRPTHDGPVCVDCVLRPERVNIPGRVVKASVGWRHGCAIDDTRSLWCWGQWKRGTNRHPEKVALPGKVDWVTAVLGTCARVSGGAVYCWGAGEEMLAPPFLGLSPQKIPDLQDAQQLAFPNGATDGIAATRKNGSVWVRGEWAHTADWLATGIENAAEIWGEAGLCARKRNNEMWCWGVTPAHTREAIRIPELDGAVDVDFSDSAYCGTLRSGQIRCGIFSPTSASNSRFVRGLNHIKSAYIGVSGEGFSEDGINWYGTGCALTTAGEVFCYGRTDCDEMMNDELFRAPQLVVPGEPVTGDEADRKERDRREGLLRSNPINSSAP